MEENNPAQALIAPNQAQSVIPPPPVTPVSEPKKKFPKIIIIAIIILVVLIVCGLLPLFLSKNSVTTTTQTTVKPTPTPTTLDTSDWQTYTNNTYGYTFKYPKDSKVTLNGLYGVDGVFGEIPGAVSFVATLSSSKYPNYIQLTISREENSKNLNINDLKKQLVYFPKENTGYLGSKINDLVVGGEQAVEGSVGSAKGEDVVLLIHNGYIYTIMIEPELEETAKEVLNSFKFTDSPDTSKWKTYTGSLVGYADQITGYTIKIPSTWRVNQYNENAYNSKGPQTNIEAFPSGPDGEGIAEESFGAGPLVSRDANGNIYKAVYALNEIKTHSEQQYPDSWFIKRTTTPTKIDEFNAVIKEQVWKAKPPPNFGGEWYDDTDVSIYVDLGNANFFVLGYSRSNLKPEYDIIFNQIVSSLKFTQ